MRSSSAIIIGKATTIEDPETRVKHLEDEWESELFVNQILRFYP